MWVSLCEVVPKIHEFLWVLLCEVVQKMTRLFNLYYRKLQNNCERISTWKDKWMKVRLRSSKDTGVPSSADTQTEKEYRVYKEKLISTFKFHFQLLLILAKIPLPNLTLGKAVFLELWFLTYFYKKPDLFYLISTNNLQSIWAQDLWFYLSSWFLIYFLTNTSISHVSQPKPSKKLNYTSVHLFDLLFEKKTLFDLDLNYLHLSAVLRIRIRDPEPFWSLDPGWTSRIIFITV